MNKSIFNYYQDILYSIDRIYFHIKDVNTFVGFKENITVYDAVERRLAIIGEALWKINKLDTTSPITYKERIIGLRHILTHDYDLVSADILWKILENNLPLLKKEVEIILNNKIIT